MVEEGSIGRVNRKKEKCPQNEFRVYIFNPLILMVANSHHTAYIEIDITRWKSKTKIIIFFLL